MEIHQNDISDLLSVLPNRTSFDSNVQYDLLICVLGFEERTHQIFDLLKANSNLKKTKLILIQYPTNEADNLINLQYFKKYRNELDSFIEIKYSRAEYSTALRNIFKEQLGSNCLKVCFDISTCSSYVFYPTLIQLIEFETDLTVAYSEAEIYYPLFKDWKAVALKAEEEKELYPKSFEEAKFQSVGVEDVYASTIFSEMNPGNHPSIMIAIPNFNPKRMYAIIEKDREINKTGYENIVWLIGEPPLSENKWRVEALEKTNNLHNAKKESKKTVSTLEYKDTLKILEDIWVKNKYEYHLSIGSLGSKMQHLGTFFFMLLHQDVGLWLAEPISFQATNYSTGFGDVHQILFGNTKELKKFINKYMLFEWKF